MYDCQQLGHNRFYMHYKYSTHKHSNTLTDLYLVKLFKGTLGKMKSSLLVSNFDLSPSLVPVCLSLFDCVRVCVIKMMLHLVCLKSKPKF